MTWTSTHLLIDNGWYDNLAVKYTEPIESKIYKDMIKTITIINKINSKFHFVNFKSLTISCKNCNSKIFS